MDTFLSALSAALRSIFRTSAQCAGHSLYAPGSEHGPMGGTIGQARVQKKLCAGNRNLLDPPQVLCGRRANAQLPSSKCTTLGLYSETVHGFGFEYASTRLSDDSRFPTGPQTVVLLYFVSGRVGTCTRLSAGSLGPASDKRRLSYSAPPRLRKGV